MLGFVVSIYPLPNTEDWLNSFSVEDRDYRDMDKRIAHFEYALGSLNFAPHTDRKLGCYRVFQGTGYPSILVASFAYVKDQLEGFEPRSQFSPFRKFEAWDATSPESLVVIEMMDQS